MYQYQGRVTKVVDGDTLDVEVDLGFKVNIGIRLRLRGLNTPEVRGPEREEGLKAKAFVKRKVEKARVVVNTYKVGKYGRYIADVFFLNKRTKSYQEILKRGTCLNELLLKKGLAEKIDY